MNDVVILKMPLLIVAISFIVVLHVASAIVSALTENKITGVLVTVLAILNAAAHLFLVTYSLIKDVPTDQVLLLIMLSAAVGIVAMGITEKKRKARRDV